MIFKKAFIVPTAVLFFLLLLPSVYAANVIQNSGFESATAWTLSGTGSVSTTAVSHSGSASGETNGLSTTSTLTESITPTSVSSIANQANSFVTWIYMSQLQSSFNYVEVAISSSQGNSLHYVWGTWLPGDSSTTKYISVGGSLPQGSWTQLSRNFWSDWTSRFPVSDTINQISLMSSGYAEHCRYSRAADDVFCTPSAGQDVFWDDVDLEASTAPLPSSTITTSPTGLGGPTTPWTPGPNSVCSGNLCVDPSQTSPGSTITIWFNLGGATQVSIYLDSTNNPIFFKTYSNTYFTINEPASGIITIPAPATIGPHQVSYSVFYPTWSGGGYQACGAFNIYVPCPIVTFQVIGQVPILISTTGVSSAQITVDSSTVSTPYSTTWAYPSTHTVTAPYIATVSSDTKGKFYDWSGYPPGQTSLTINTPSNPPDCLQYGPQVCRIRKGEDVCNTPCLQYGLKLTADYSPQYQLTVNNGGYGSTTQGIYRTGAVGGGSSNVVITEPDVYSLQIMPQDTPTFWDVSSYVQYGAVYGISCGPSQTICTGGSYKVLSGYFESDPYNNQPLNVYDNNNLVITGPTRTSDSSGNTYYQTINDWQAWTLEFYGYYVAPQAGTYSFTLNSAALGTMWVNGQKVVDLPLNQWSGSGSAQLQKGPNYIYIKATTWSLTATAYFLANNAYAPNTEVLQLSATGPNGQTSIPLTGTLYKWKAQWASQAPKGATDVGIQVGSVWVNSPQTVSLTWVDKTLPGVPSTPIVISGPTQTGSMSLQAGWNLVSFPFQQLTVTNGNCLSKDFAFYGWNSATQRWDKVTDASQLAAGRGYWMLLSQACQISYSGSSPIATSQISLVSGWNAVGATNTVQTIANVKGTCNILDAQTWDATAQSWTPATQLTPTQGYWIRVSSNCNFS